jgi:proteasome lid subunit RPN8/RPN11
MIVEIASGLSEELVAAAAASPEAEICGLLLGQPQRIEALRPARNVAIHPERAFEIDPATLLAVHREARGLGQQVIGHYHSHPGGQPQPSRRDAARAIENGQLWLIIAPNVLTAWRTVSADTDGALHGRFIPVHLEVR